MTKSKRFVMKDPNDWGYPITDTDTGKVYSCASNIWMKELCTDINKIVAENEQLKQFIYDNLDEDICDVCSYQYLEKSQMEKYYVAKCKKGYDNCSKGTVIHCKDFKFKELSE